MNTTTTSGPLTSATSANSANLGGALARRHEWLPLPTLLGYALGFLTLDGAMRRVSPVMGCEARAIALPFAEAAIDVDKPADLALVESILAKRAA